MNYPYMAAAGAALSLILTIFLVLSALKNKRSRVMPDLYESFQNISRRLEKMEDMAGKVDSLSQIFSRPHVRGAAGETMLESLLGNWLPAGGYSMQHPFSNGTRVDAIIRLGRFIIPIDSKFPVESISGLLEHGQRALNGQMKRIFLKHSDDISRKYILPEEGTMQFALMYIPSEKIYYKAFVEDDGDFMQDILKKGVLPVSPSNIFIYLQTVAYGLRGFSFTENQKEILDRLHRLREDFTILKKYYDVGTTHMKNLQKVWGETSVRLSAMDSAIERMERPSD